MSEGRCRVYPEENAQIEVLETKGAQAALSPVEGPMAHVLTSGHARPGTKKTALVANSSATALLSLDWRQ